MRIDNLDSGGLADLERRVRALETGTPLKNASVSAGRLRFFGGSQLLIQDGNLTVIGTATISGRLNGDGTISWTGPADFTGHTELNGNTELNGPTTVTGKTIVNGNMDVNGIMDIDGPLGVNGLAYLRGNTEVTGDLEVTGGGKITVDNMTIGQTANGGGLDFTNGGQVAAEGTGVAMYSGTGFVGASPTRATLNFGVNNVIVNSSGTHIGGDLYGDLPTKSGVTANVHVDGAGKLWRVA